MTYAPIVVFVYNRLDHLIELMESLKSCPEAKNSRLFVFSDGPKNESDSMSIEKVRAYLKSLDGFLEITVYESLINNGLANSIISGVTKIVNQFESVIVLEDDLILSPFFLKFMNDGLNLYRNDYQIASIHGYIYPTNKNLPETFFIRGADCWGWATWKRAWIHFNPDGKSLLEKLNSNNLTRKFDFDNTYPYTKMLIGQINGKNNSWAIRWNASIFLENMFTLYPGKSLVKNIGNDGTGENCDNVDYFNVQIVDRPIVVGGILIEESKVGREAFKSYFRSIQLSFLDRFIKKIKKVIKS